jgi:hypothetical protein
MKSRILATALALALAMGTTCTVFAETDAKSVTQESESQESTVTVTYTVADSYEVTIPADVTLSADGSYESSGEVKANNVLIKAGSVLNVKLTSTNAGEAADADSYVLKDTSGASSIAYEIKKGDAAVANGSVVLAVSAGTAGEQTASLTFATSEKNVKADTVIKSGAHTDTLTFTVSVDKDAE